MGVDLNPTTKARFGFRVPTKSLQQCSKMVPSVCELGIERCRFAERGNGLFLLPDQEESVAKVVVSAIVGRPEGDRRAIVANPFFNHPACLQGVAQVVVELGVSGIQRQRAPVCCDGVSQLPRILKDIAEIGMVNRVVRIVLDRTPDQTDRRIEIVVSQAHKPEQVRCIRVSRVIRKQLLVNRGSVIQPASAMQLERPIQQGGIR
ncbi:MAG TPA: hypothetical protein VGR42_07980 [Casimicrobiaceae bacterium]|nr:hypothetical protein [Casimicrobiaceae bacterium]